MLYLCWIVLRRQALLQVEVPSSNDVQNTTGTGSNAVRGQTRDSKTLKYGMRATGYRLRAEWSVYI